MSAKGAIGAIGAPGAAGAALAELADEVAAYVERRLPAKVPGRARPLRIHDPVWGTLELMPHEAALIDSELFQRLRRIRQLSGAALIFPGATHSRFEHSLGVMHLAGKMCAGLGANAKAAARPTPAQVLALRLAALCHDLGHGPFSHSSEACLAALMPDVDLGALGGGAAEALSVLIVGSAPLRAYLAALSERDGLELDGDFAAAAVGGKLGGSSHHLGEIIHGPFDADKLDYLARDGQCCGIPIRPDSAKIYSTLEVHDDGGTSRLVCGAKAAAALMQIVHHKQHMFAVVYHHRVMRIFTAMLAKALELAVADRTPIAGRPLSSPVDLLELDDEMLLSPGVVEAGSRAARLLMRLRGRELYKVAASFGPSKRKMIEGNEDNLRAQIAAAAQVDADQVLLDVAPRLGNREAGGGLVRTASGVHRLIESMPQLEVDGVELFNQLESHLVLCPPPQRAAVAAAAEDLLGDLI